MHICVCVKQTPDSSSVYVDPISGQVDYERFVQVLNPADACAVEAAVRLKEQFGGTVHALTLGPEDAEGVLRAALAIGADTAIRLWNPQASDWGPFTVAAALAAYIRRGQGGGKLMPLLTTRDSRGMSLLPPFMPDLVLCGDASSDWASGIVGPALAEMLDLPQITSVMQLKVVGKQDMIRLQVTRRLERGYRELLEAQPPLLITVTSDLNEPRYPSLPAHMAALRARIPLLDPQLFLGESLQSESDETTLIEMHTPRPRPRRIAAPDSRHSAFERIGEIVSSGAIGRQTQLVEGPPEELAKALVEFLKSKGFVE